MTDSVLRTLAELGMHTPNRSGAPIIEIPLARHEDIADVGTFLFDHGIYVTLAAYPLVPKHEVGFRVQVTAANTDAEIEQLNDVLRKLANAFDFQPATAPAPAAVLPAADAGVAA
jgi:7-keto-8-aminopelargonate synthetase-like enzyme